jgi:phage terminase small subunit
MVREMTDEAETLPVDKLSLRQEAFVEAYLETWNATEAARRAGYKSPNMSGPRLMVNDGISARITARLSEMCISADETLTRLTQQATATIAPFFRYGPDGEVLGLDTEYLRTHGHLVKRMKVKPEEIDFELYDGQAALVQIGKFHKLFVERREVTGDDGGPLKIVITRKDKNE